MLPEHSRPQRWNTRVPTNEHYQRFRNVFDVHNLTRAWLAEIGASQKRHEHLLPRVRVPGVEENLWMLEKLSETYAESNLDSLLDESMPDELLDRLERTVWVTQSWTFREILEKTPDAERSAMINLLEQSSWKSGRASAKHRWSELPRGSRENLRALIATFLQTYVSGFPRREAMLVRRATPGLCELELLGCPHQSTYPEVRLAGGPLCLQHYHWLRGFAYELNTTVDSEYLPAEKDRHCLQRWILPVAP